MIIDFGPDLQHKLNNYMCAGSFYVALTRIRGGENVYLKSFDKYYIKVNTKIEETRLGLQCQTPALSKV